MPKERSQELKRRKKILEEKNQKKSKLFTGVMILRLSEILIQSIGFSMVFSSFSLILFNRYNVSQGFIGIVFAIAGVEMMIISGTAIKPLLMRFGDKKLLKFLTLLVASVFLIFPFLIEVWMIFFFLIPLIFSMTVIRPVLIANIQKAAPPDQQGVISGWRVNMMSIAQIVAPLISTSFLEFGSSFKIIGIELSYYLIGFTSAILLFMMFALIMFDIKKYSKSFRKSMYKKNNEK
ncbi:MAG: MFS transporter [Promethearchaeota archaeon]